VRCKRRIQHGVERLSRSSSTEAVADPEPEPLPAEELLLDPPDGGPGTGADGWLASGEPPCCRLAGALPSAVVAVGATEAPRTLAGAAAVATSSQALPTLAISPTGW
jgi:hypothetical protein